MGFITADDIPDQYIVDFELQITGNADDTWTANFSIIVNAPVFQIGSLTIDDNAGGNGDGRLDPGETANIIIETSNTGHSVSPVAIASLFSSSGWITLNTSDDLGQIGVGVTVDASFSVSVSSSAPIGESVDLDFDVVADNYSASKLFMASIGLMIEDWETGDFSRFPWTLGGDANWSLVTESPYEGTYCAKSGPIVDSQISDMSVTVNVTADGQMSFYRMVSSESGWDYLKFFIDGGLVDEWSGTYAWGQVSFPVTAGVHTFRWQYYKDGSVSSGSDCAWVDYIVFPYPVPPVTPPYQTEFEEVGSTPTGWHNDTDDDFNWMINSGTTPSSSTGPSGDHTTGSGYYMYTEASDPNYPNKQADLITPTFDLSLLADVEVRFWYHMYGANMGTLHLDVFHNDAWINDVMTAISGNQGDQWHEQVVDLTTYAGEVIKMRFRGITGSNYTSDMAIDDFSIDGTVLAPYFSVELTAFLEGPFNGSGMNTNLIALDDFPLSQPFYDLYGYDGGESSGSIPNPDIVDWVLVELRDATSASAASEATWVASQAGFLLNNGSVVSVDGSSNMFFDEAFSHGLYAVIYTRNHLAVLSASELTGGGGIYSYDFSTDIGQAHGGAIGYNYLGSSIWGMVSGDGNCDGGVSLLDEAPEWEFQAGETGYKLNDHNMDGQVDNKDKDDYLIPNIDKVCQVPE